MSKRIKILLFGAGLIGRQVVAQYLERFTVLAFIDNDKNKQNGSISDVTIIHPEKIQCYDYDYIVITSTSIEPIKNQLLEFGIKKNKIIQHIEQTTIAKQRFPFDALFFIILCILLIIYLFNILFNQF